MTDRSSADLELGRFARANSRAFQLVRIATEDYASARCLVLNGLITGLTLGAQAIEKFLKAYILFKDPDCNVKKDFGHSLPELLRAAATLSPQMDFSGFSSVVEKFHRHYHTRYADHTRASTFMAGTDIYELDTLVVLLNENMPCPRHAKYRSSFYHFVTDSLLTNRVATPPEIWIKKDNRALLPLMPRINAEAAAVLAELYPKG